MPKHCRTVHASSRVSTAQFDLLLACSAVGSLLTGIFPLPADAAPPEQPQPPEVSWPGPTSLSIADGEGSRPTLTMQRSQCMLVPQHLTALPISCAYTGSALPLIRPTLPSPLPANQHVMLTGPASAGPSLQAHMLMRTLQTPSLAVELDAAAVLFTILRVLFVLGDLQPARRLVSAFRAASLVPCSSTASSDTGK